MNKVQDKLYNLEATPPPGMWDKLSAALDEQAEEAGYISRLREVEVAPPAGIWSRINATLDQSASSSQEQENIYPVKTTTPVRRISFLKYAAAAAIIAAVTFGILQFVGNSGTGNDQQAINTPKEQSATEAPSSTPQKVESSLGDVIKPTNNLPTATPSRKAVLASKIRNNAAVAVNRPRYKNSSNNITYASQEDDGANLRERYVVTTTTNGNFIRMSKKWTSMLCCITGEEQDQSCKDQLKKWQQKMATSPLTPAPGSFMDILSLANSLNDDTQL
jgi:hypothetical protein